MMTIEKSAKTKEEAIKLALAELGISDENAINKVTETKGNISSIEVPEGEVVIDLIEEGSKGFLGLGSKDAVIKATLNPNCTKRAENFLSKIFELTGEEVNVDAVKDGEILKVNLSGPDMGIVIGKRGETLDALQHLTSLVVNRGDCDFMKVSLDAENYREKRNEALESLAKKLANKVIRTRRNTTLEPMNAYERRIIHATLQDNENVTTYSVGQGINRKVVIALKQKDNNK